MAEYGYMDVLGVPFKLIGTLPCMRLYPLNDNSVVGELPLFDMEFNWFSRHKSEGKVITRDQAIALALSADFNRRVGADLGAEPVEVKSYGVYAVLRKGKDRLSIPFFAYNDDFALDYLFRHAAASVFDLKLFALCDFSLVDRVNPMSGCGVREIKFTEMDYAAFSENRFQRVTIRSNYEVKEDLILCR